MKLQSVAAPRAENNVTTKPNSTRNRTSGVSNKFSQAAKPGGQETSQGTKTSPSSGLGNTPEKKVRLGAGSSAQQNASDTQQEAQASKPGQERIILGKPRTDGEIQNPKVANSQIEAKPERQETSRSKERETQESSKRGVQENTQIIQRKNIEDQNLEQSKTASQKDDGANSDPARSRDAGARTREASGALAARTNTNAGRALSRSAQRRGVNWNTSAAQPFAKMMNMSDRGLARVMTGALRRPDGQLGNLPVKFKVFNSNTPGNGNVEALTSNGTIFINSRMAALAKSNDPQARAVFASILREELAEAAFQGQKGGFSQGDFGEETTLRMRGEYISLPSARKDDLKTNSDTASIAVNGAKIVGEAAASKPSTFRAYTTDGKGGLKAKTLRTSGARQTFFAEKGPGGRYWVVATRDTPKERRKLVSAPIAGSYVKKTQSTGQYRLEIPTTVVTKKSEPKPKPKPEATPTPTIIPPNQAGKFKGKYTTKYFVAHLNNGKWEKGKVKSKRTAYWVSVLLKKGKGLPDKIPRSNAKSSVKLVPVTFTAVKTKEGYKVASSKSKGTRYTVKAEVNPKDYFKNKKNGAAKGS